MTNLSFVPSELIGTYLSQCWIGLPLVPNNDSCGGSDTYLTTGTIRSSNFEKVNEVVQALLLEFSGFCAFAVLFGLSLIASFFSLHYLLKNWRSNAPHIVVTVFTVLLSAFNIVVFALRTLTMAKLIASAVCPAAATFGLAFELDSSLSFVLLAVTEPAGIRPLYPAPGIGSGLSLSLVPIFLWISDAFLLYRAWVIWVHHRKYTFIPALTFLASIVAGIIWLNQTLLHISDRGILIETIDNSPKMELVEAILRWVPALGFSCGLDAITTGMIAGRLIYHHKKQRKLIESHSTIYLPVVTIFIESAALSLISKILQLSLQSLGHNPIVVPLCTISSNLIVLRKALGADVGKMLAKGNQDLSTLRFQLPSKRQACTNGDSIPGGFEAHLIRTIGGHTIDISHPEAEDSEQSSLSNAPKA